MFFHVKILTLILDKWLGIEKEDRWDEQGGMCSFEKRELKRVWKLSSDTERIVIEKLYLAYFLCLLRSYGKESFSMID